VRSLALRQKGKYLEAICDFTFAVIFPNSQTVSAINLVTTPHLPCILTIAAPQSVTLLFICLFVSK
jgi:hypothetical protein